MMSGPSAWRMRSFLSYALLFDVFVFPAALRANAVMCESHNPAELTAIILIAMSKGGELAVIVMTNAKAHAPSMKINDCLMHLGQRPRLAFKKAPVFVSIAFTISNLPFKEAPPGRSRSFFTSSLFGSRINAARQSTIACRVCSSYRRGRDWSKHGPNRARVRG
jgi:hypothetical protein